MSRPKTIAAVQAAIRAERENRGGISYSTDKPMNRTKMRSRVERTEARGYLSRLKARAESGDQAAVVELDRYEKSKAALDAYDAAHPTEAQQIKEREEQEAAEAARLQALRDATPPVGGGDL